jgi:NADH-quinone oxidoreductase subunit F
MLSETKLLTRRVGAYSPVDLHAYENLGGLVGLRRALAMRPEDVIEEVRKSGLTGRGGAGFPAGQKWLSAAGQRQQPKYLICNADEGELGTAKDRVLLEGDPWAVLEGMLIAAYAIGAGDLFIYIRGEYCQIFDLWETLAGEARNVGLLGPSILGTAMSASLRVARGRGLYIAGEEQALIASLGARRPESAPRPPFPSERGLLDRPTVVHNVETLANVPLILAKGADEYGKTGTTREPGTRLFSLSGDVRRPGVYEIAVGASTLRSLIEELGGGTPDGKPVKAVQPGGGVTALLGADSLDCRLTNADLRAAGTSAGTGAVIVYGQRWDAVRIVDHLLAYYGHESCGHCLPCRLGTSQMRRIIQRLLDGAGRQDDLARLRQIGETCVQLSLCGMGQTFAAPVLSAMKLFPADFEKYACTSVGKRERRAMDRTHDQSLARH